MFELSIALFVSTVILATWSVFAARGKRKSDEEKAAAKANVSERNRYGYTYSDSVSDFNLTPWLRIGAASTGFLCLVFLFFSSFTQVSTRNVAVITTFGKPVGQLDNGPHFILPWESTTEMPATIQTDNHVQTPNKDCVTTRIAYQIVACSDVSLRWRIKESAVDGLYQNYQSFDHVRDSLVSRQLYSSMNSVFQNYDPLAVNTNGTSAAPSLTSLANQVEQQMTKAIGDQIEISSVFVSVLHYDSSTQQKLNQVQAQVAQTRVANQAEQTATAQAAANRALQASVSNDPNVLVAKCLDTLNEMVSKGQTIPPGFSCWPGSGSSLVVPAAGGR